MDSIYYMYDNLY